MILFSLKIADQIFNIKANFATTKIYCHGYLSDLTGDVSVEILQSDIEKERANATSLYNAEMQQEPCYQDGYLETLALLRKIAEIAPQMDCFLFHGSAIMVDGKAYLFTAPSGTGKSTHASLWREMLGERAVMINDDKPFLAKKEKRFYVCGSPWNGKHKLGSPVSAPLSGICILYQAPENTISKLTADQAMIPLMQQCYMPKNADSALRLLNLTDSLLNSVPVYSLGCNISREAAELCYNTIK